MTTTERIAAFRGRHLINVIEEQHADFGHIYRCASDELRVHPTRDGRWRHDSAEVTDLLNAEYGGSWGKQRAIERILETVRDGDEDEQPDRNPEGDPALNGAFG